MTPPFWVISTSTSPLSRWHAHLVAFGSGPLDPLVVFQVGRRKFEYCEKGLGGRVGGQAVCRSYRLEAGPSRVSCERSDEEPEIQLDVSELGTIYLGGQGLRTLARAGRARGSPSALALADQMFAWDPAPWCPEIF